MCDSVKISCCITMMCFVLAISLAVLSLIDVENGVANSHFGEAAIYVFAITLLALLVKISIKQDQTITRTKISPTIQPEITSSV